MNVPYRYNINRSVPPIILASPGAYALFNGSRKRTILAEQNNPGGFKRLVHDLCEAFFPVVQDERMLHIGGQFGGGCIVSLKWSSSPEKPDIILVQSDSIEFYKRLKKYNGVEDPRFLAEFTPLILI